MSQNSSNSLIIRFMPKHQKRNNENVLRLAQYSATKVCYFCGGPNTSKEHIPPRTVFRGFDCDSLTAPSCDDHNTEKSDKDQIIVAELLLTLDQMRKNYGSKSSLTQNVLKAIENAAPTLAQFKDKVPIEPYLHSSSGLDFRAPFIHYFGQKGILGWLIQMTVGLTWKVTGNFDPESQQGKNWIWSPILLEGKGPWDLETAAQSLLKNKAIEQKYLTPRSWWPGWSASPRSYPSDIYRFDFSVVSIREGSFYDANVVFKHIFYNDLIFYVGLSASSDTREHLTNTVKIISRQRS